MERVGYGVNPGMTFWPILDNGAIPDGTERPSSRAMVL
jgi:hypothetical protein